MHILFLSANDFKEKSIQVIRKTPESYVAAGWKVTYIVARDYSKAGNYYYEDEINPEGVDVIRIPMPLTRLRDRTKTHFFRTIYTQLAGYSTIFKLAKEAREFIRSSPEKVDVIYGYEVHGVCAVSRLKKLCKKRKIKIVSRFQGTWMTKYIKEKNYLKQILNLDDLIALRSRADLCIMTNDGTEGDFAINKLKSRARHNFKFWVNGVDEQKIPEAEYIDLKQKYNPNGNKLVVLSISRLEEWKRVERIINTISYVVNSVNYKDILYLIIGEGSFINKYKQMVAENKLTDYVDFVGAVKNEEVKKYLNMADVFFSTYDLSNVGNPLLEAIRSNKIIFTLNNGTTSEWITHKENGFIYDMNDSLIESMGKDLYLLTQDQELQSKILKNIALTEKEKLWTWPERFAAEINAVEALF